MSTMLYYSVETLYHYRCQRCDTWFSVSDPKIHPLYCLHCGEFFLDYEEDKNHLGE